MCSLRNTSTRVAFSESGLLQVPLKDGLSPPPPHQDGDYKNKGAGQQAWGDAGQREARAPRAGRTVTQPLWAPYGESSAHETESPCDPDFCVQVHPRTGGSEDSESRLYPAFTAAGFAIAKGWKQPRVRRRVKGYARCGRSAQGRGVQAAGGGHSDPHCPAGGPGGHRA